MKLFKRDNNQYIIMALNTDNDKTVFKEHAIPVLKELIGSYKGETESSYLVPNNEVTRMLAKQYNQESILELLPMENGKRLAWVRNINTWDTIEAGPFVNVGTKQPDCDAWTYDIETGNYYIIK